jgi:ribose 5-phosphate isomerase B
MDSKKTVYIVSDHNGTAARNYVFRTLERLGHFPVDYGPTEYEGKVDYPDFAQKVCRQIQTGAAIGESTVGILICGTGAGMVMAANTFKGIRAALGVDRATAELMRQHNDANVLVLGQWVTPLGKMDEIIEAFLTAEFEGGRHIPRVEKLEALKK